MPLKPDLLCSAQVLVLHCPTRFTFNILSKRYYAVKHLCANNQLVTRNVTLIKNIVTFKKRRENLLFVIQKNRKEIITEIVNI